MSSPARRLAVCFGGPSPEHDVSILTGLQAVRALSTTPSYGAIHALYWSKNGDWFEVPSDLEARSFADGVPAAGRSLRLVSGPTGGFRARRGRLAGRDEALELDAIVVCCHGGPGEDGRLQGAFDLAGLAYTGPTAAGAAIGMDKLASGAVLAAAGLPVLPRLALLPSTKEPDFPPPYIVKPRFGGSSIGIDVVADFSTALARLNSNVHLRQGAVIEPFRHDLHDLQVAVRTWPGIDLSAIERPIRRGGTSEILDYTDKYVGGEGMLSAPRELPAQIDAAQAGELRAVATEAASLLGVRGVARIDFLASAELLVVNEVNTVPGSLSRHLFVDPPLAFAELIDAMVTEAIERPAARFSSAGSDGSVLRGAGSIDGKLG